VPRKVAWDRDVCWFCPGSVRPSRSRCSVVRARPSCLRGGGRGARGGGGPAPGPCGRGREAPPPAPPVEPGSAAARSPDPVLDRRKGGGRARGSACCGGGSHLLAPFGSTGTQLVVGMYPVYPGIPMSFLNDRADLLLRGRGALEGDVIHHCQHCPGGPAPSANATGGGAARYDAIVCARWALQLRIFDTGLESARRTRWGARERRRCRSPAGATWQRPCRPLCNPQRDTGHPIGPAAASCRD